MLMEHMKGMQWYVSSEGDDCGTLPSEDQIMTGPYMKAACSAADVRSITLSLRM